MAEITNPRPFPWGYPPDTLPPAAVDAWARLAAETSRLPNPKIFAIHWDAVVEYCVAVALLEEAQRSLLTDGLLIAGRSSADSGRTVKNPAFQIYREQSAIVARCRRALGLAPAYDTATADAASDYRDPANPFLRPA